MPRAGWIPGHCLDLHVLDILLGVATVCTYAADEVKLD